MYPLVRFVKSLKAVNSIPPSYEIFLLNNQSFFVYYEEYSLMIKIGTKEYYEGDLEDVNYAIKHINKLLTQRIPGQSEEEDDLEDLLKPGGAKPDKPLPPPPKPKSPGTTPPPPVIPPPPPPKPEDET